MSARERARRLLPPLLASLAFCLVIDRFNTPLGPSVGSDNAIYLTMGTALARGYAPYTEIFDHKGPLLFALETLPQLFCGGYQTFTVFLLEWASMFASLCLLRALCARRGLARSGPVALAFLALCAPCMGGGNLSEEYALPVTLLGLLLIARAFGGETIRERLFAPAAGMGALAMAAFLTRANNALPLCGAMLALSLLLAAKREWKRLGDCAMGALCGGAGLLLPVALWLASRKALRAAFYGAITHNLLYAGAQGGSRMQALLGTSYGHMAMLIAGVSALGALCCALRTRRAAIPAALLFGAAFAGAGAFLSHKFYQHYLLLGAPLSALGAAEILLYLQSRSARAARLAGAAAAIVCCAALCLVGWHENETRIAERADYPRFEADAQALYAQVPPEARDRFMAYRVEPRWYVAARALPCMRFYFLQEMLGEADPRVMDEIARTFEEDPPEYLVIYYGRAFNPPYDERVKAVFESRYAFVDARGEYQLLRLER